MVPYLLATVALLLFALNLELLAIWMRVQRLPPGSQSVLSETFSPSQSGGVAASTPEPTPGIVLAAGDIADCEATGDEATAAVVKSEPGTVLALGDNAYKFGSADDFAKCYGPSWGQFKDRTHPVLGNHDYRDTAAQAYYDYFGAQAGPRGQGYYSFEVGPWHVIALDSNCDIIDCRPGGPELTWLEHDLSASKAQCQLVYWHHPRFSSGNHGDDQRMQQAWRLLVTAGVEIVLVGHDHDYERFAPIGDKGQLDPQGGIREFVVGTGGGSLDTFTRTRALSEARGSDFGVLRLVLSGGRYDWKFLPAAGGTFTDSGSAACH
jgi:alkaline phosphatase